MADFRSLVGSTKPFSDIKSTPWRYQYTNSTTVGPAVNGGQIRITLPKRDFMDVSSLRFRGKLNVTTSDANARLASKTVGVLLDRVRCVIGTKVVFDQEASGLISNQLENYLVKETDSLNFEKYLSDYPDDLSTRASQITTAHTADREVVGHLGPHGSFLNSSTIIPLKMMQSPVHIDIYFSPPAECFISATDAGLTYSLSDFELIWNGLTSPSLDQYFGQNTHEFNVTSFDHVYNQIPASTTNVNLRIPSNHSFIHAVTSFVRTQADVSDMTAEKLEDCFVSATDYENFDYRIQTRSIYEEPVEDLSDYYREFTHVYPFAKESKSLTPTGFTTNQFPLTVNLQGAPAQFAHMLRSGVSSDSLATDMLLQLRFNSGTAALYQVDSYIVATVTYKWSRGKLELKM